MIRSPEGVNDSWVLCGFLVGDLFETQNFKGFTVFLGLLKGNDICKKNRGRLKGKSKYLVFVPKLLMNFEIF